MFLNAVKFARKYDNSKIPGYSLKIKEIKLRVRGKCGIITSDLKSAGSGFCRAKARLAAHRTSENILPLNLLSDDKIRRTAVSVYTDLIYGIINFITFVKSLFFQKVLVLNPYPQTPFPGKGAKCGATALTPLGATPQTPFLKVM